jgi:hypothetical protein
MVPSILFWINHAFISFWLVWMQVICTKEILKFNNICIWTNFNNEIDRMLVLKQVKPNCIPNYSYIQLADMQFNLLGYFNFDWYITPGQTVLQTFAAKYSKHHFNGCFLYSSAQSLYHYFQHDAIIYLSSHKISK